jgi:hypothetical protein
LAKGTWTKDRYAPLAACGRCDATAVIGRAATAAANAMLLGRVAPVGWSNGGQGVFGVTPVFDVLRATSAH